MINRLVVNGCSYMNYYANGNGHIDLAQKLNIGNSDSLAVNGSCNSRIIRTTLKDSYSAQEPTLYIVGTTFLTRYELPAASGRPESDGKWISFSGAGTSIGNKNFDDYFTKENLSRFSDLYNKFTALGLPDLAQHLMYSMTSMIDSLKSRGHKIVVFNTAEHTVEYYLQEKCFDLFRAYREIIGEFQWRSIPWQFEQGAPYPPEDEQYPADCRHVAPGGHSWLNEFLTNYIKEHKILE
jgi:hypothetical protein